MAAKTAGMNRTDFLLALARMGKDSFLTLTAERGRLWLNCPLFNIWWWSIGELSDEGSAMKSNKNLETLRKAITDNLAHVPEVTLVYLFGSQVEGHVGPLSDYDLGVLVDRPESGPYIRSRLAFELGRKTADRKVDIVLLNRAPIELAFAVISSGKLLYQRSDVQRIEYEARIMGLYFDYLPVLRIQRDDILRGGEYEARIQRYRKAFGRTARTLIKVRNSPE